MSVIFGQASVWWIAFNFPYPRHGNGLAQHCCNSIANTLGLALLTLSWDKNWDSHSPMNGYPSFYPRIALVAPSPGVTAVLHWATDITSSLIKNKRQTSMYTCMINDMFVLVNGYFLFTSNTVSACVTLWRQLQTRFISRGWDVIWRDLFVQIELGVDITSLGIE